MKNKLNLGITRKPLYKQMGLPKWRLSHYENILTYLICALHSGIITDGEYNKIIVRFRKALNEVAGRQNEKQN
jgi:hypothetical protein